VPVARGNFVTVTNLFIKRAHGARLESVAELDVSPQGIAGGVSCSPLRQVLITSRSVTEECGLQAGELRENIVVDCARLYDLPSGTVVRIGAALVRLTFHCEPCKKIMHLIDFDSILHKRGYLGCFLNSGRIAIGDAVAPTEQRLEAIPYAVKDRIRWFLTKQNAGLAAIDLAHGLGLPSSYARAIPRLLDKFALMPRPQQ
jgi:MOSC domain-containing protein YiiM